MNNNNELTKTQEILTQLQGYVKQNNLSITVDLVGSWLWAYGEDTKAHKEYLKTLGFKWGANKQKWYYHEKEYKKFSNKKFTYDEIKAMNGSERVL